MLPETTRESRVWSAVRSVLLAASEDPPLRRIAPEEAVPLALQQESSCEDGAAHVPMKYDVRGPVDPVALDTAIREVARRHQVLRTAFPSIDDTVTPVVLSVASIRLAVIDCATRDEAEKLAEAETRRVFRVDRGPLVAFTLLRIAGGEHLLLTTFHHLVFDGWSLSIFARELSLLYDAFAAGRPSPLPEPALQYADYARWQRDWLQSPSARRQRDWWVEELRPVSRSTPEPQVGGGPIVRHVHWLDVRLAKSIRALAVQLDTTPFVVTLAAFDLLMHACSGREELCVCTLSAGRSRPQLLDVIGCFTNALAIRAIVRPEMSLAETIETLRAPATGAFANGDFPLENALASLGRRMFPMQLVFLFQNVPAAHLRLAGIDCPQFPLPHPTADYALMLYLTDGPRGILCEWYGQPQIITPAHLVQLAAAYETLLDELLDDPHRAPQRPIACDPQLRRTLARLLRMRKQTGFKH